MNRHLGHGIRKELIFIVLTLAVTVFIVQGHSSAAPGILFIQLAYDPPTTVEEPLVGNAKELVELLDSQTEEIEVDEVYFGGRWISVDYPDGRTVNYNVFGDKLCICSQRQDEEPAENTWDPRADRENLHWYRFTEKEFTRMEYLISRLPKHQYQSEGEFQKSRRETAP